MKYLTPKSPLLKERGLHAVKGVRSPATLLKTSQFADAMIERM